MSFLTSKTLCTADKDIDDLGGSPSRKFLRFNTIVFRKDKWGIILKVIICTLKIRVLWGRKVVPMCRIRGR